MKSIKVLELIVAVTTKAALLLAGRFLLHRRTHLPSSDGSRPRGLFIIPPPFLRAELVAAAGLRAAVLRSGAARSLGRQLHAPNAPTSLPSQEEMSGCSCRAGGYGQSSRTLVRGADNGPLC